VSWENLDAWRARIRHNATVAERREVVRAWAEAAGGRIEEDTVVLPAGLPRSFARAELVTHATIAGLKVAVMGADGTGDRT
jgi:hypothetical protein